MRAGARRPSSLPPNLIRIFAMGRCELDALPLLYLTMEYADEDLSQVLPHRSLSPEEAREMLPPALGALEYLHAGFCSCAPATGEHHGGERLPEAFDRWHLPGRGQGRDEPVRTIRRSGEGVVSPAGDVWSLGMTLIEILTGASAAAETRPSGPICRSLSQDRRHARSATPGSAGLSRGFQKPGRSGRRGRASAEPVRARNAIAPVGVLVISW